MRGLRPDAGDIVEGAVGLPLASALPVESDGKAVGFIADLLDQMQDRRMMLQDNGLIFLTQDIEDFFFLGC